MNFYKGDEKVKSCQDYDEKNISEINSIFQITNPTKNIRINLHNCEFKEKMCPIVFKNSDMDTLSLSNLANTFYKKKLFQFDSLEFRDLGAKIRELELDNVLNIDLDASLLNPSVFEMTDSLFVYGSVNSVSNDLIKSLKNLKKIEFLVPYARKVFHKNGIDWIKEKNKDLNVNMSNFTEVEKNIKKAFLISISFYDFNYERISIVFPDEDFCIYKDFPFNQLVYFILFISTLRIK